ncbi:hypothetical protein HU200_012076 [Digitaria exilis]|uniref:Protein kinase domain-containing protein n=1 Tax=Digitaria exilis TaxID=1010633 RepID=A0A835FFB7_9POAL|nr:hypothetical protein HU200_012076 [Digitaria exilis]
MAKYNQFPSAPASSSENPVRESQFKFCDDAASPRHRLPQNAAIRSLPTWSCLPPWSCRAGPPTHVRRCPSGHRAGCASLIHVHHRASPIHVRVASLADVRLHAGWGYGGIGEEELGFGRLEIHGVGREEGLSGQVTGSSGIAARREGGGIGRNAEFDQVTEVAPSGGLPKQATGSSGIAARREGGSIGGGTELDQARESVSPYAMPVTGQRYFPVHARRLDDWMRKRFPSRFHATMLRSLPITLSSSRRRPGGRQGNKRTGNRPALQQWSLPSRTGNKQNGVALLCPCTTNATFTPQKPNRLLPPAAAHPTHGLVPVNDGGLEYQKKKKQGWPLVPAGRRICLPKQTIPIFPPSTSPRAGARAQDRPSTATPRSQTKPAEAPAMAPPRRAYLHLPLALLLLPFCCLLLLRGAAAQPQQPAAGDAPQLLAIKAAWGDPPVLAAWNATAAAALCAWPYVGCDAAGRVANLTLANTNVTGPVPDAVGNLTGLAHLDVSNNNINGSFPTALYRCRSLQYLNLSQNYLAGVLPADIGSGLGENLTTLDLNGNYFNGTIPASLSGLRNLQFLALNGNRFTGTIPADLGELTSLQYLYLAYNPFDEGQLPGSFKNLTNMIGLYLTQCNLFGNFPNYVWSFKNLQMFSLYMNNITGGLVVDGSFAAYSLTLIDISVNNISGVIPEVFGRLDNLTALIIFTNNFHGDIPASIGKLPSLQVLRIYGNRLTGTLPPELGKHSPGLNRIEADFNELTGPIPEGLCAGGQFQWFTAKGNNLNGSIPAGLANCTTLYRLQLDSNNLTGEVPQALWTAAQLQLLQLPNNQLTGSLPATIGPNLTTLHIGSNQFSGNIPATAGALHLFTAENNQFSGPIPASLGDGMPLLLTLNLSGNYLSEGIPTSIAKLSNMSQMDLSRNQLTGDIPAELGSMPALNLLDLSSNKLSGDIPLSLLKLNINSLNLSSNQLSGTIPSGFATGAYDDSFLDNPGLCTTNSAPGKLNGVRSCGSGGSQDGASSGGVSHALRTGLLVAGAVLLLIAAAFAFFVVRDIKKRRRVAEEDGWKLTPFVQDLGFGEASILRGLREENVVGRGGSGRVYRVTYTNRLDGRAGAVAVKQIRTAGKLNEKLEREFESEAGILGNLRHINIVRLVCCLSNAESKLLVYDYMDNGSLDTWLHGEAAHVATGGHHPMARARSARREQMDWPTRLKVAVGAAQGLCYMHHECEPPIVHRDVKTSNILLDSEFRAKVADFGLARMLVQAGAPETMSAVAGSFGYMAPECAYTKKVNEKVDVYSFGVVLLELTTGKEANDGGEHGSLAEWARHHCQSEGSIADATDKSIRYAGYSNEIEVVFRLGVLCTADMPSKRPAMKGVLQILVECSEQTHHKSKTERVPEYDAAPLLLPHHGSRRKQLSNGSGIDIEEKSDFDSIV